MIFSIHPKSSLRSLSFRRNMVTGLFVFSFLATLAARLRDLFFRSGVESDVWQTGEWLINYGGGAVRRGAFGSLLLALTPANQRIVTFVLICIQLLCYAMLLIVIWKLTNRHQWSWTAVLIACNPGAVLFVGTNGGLTRKELLGLNVLVLLFFASVVKSTINQFVLLCSAILLFTLSVFSSEINCLLLPGIIYILNLLEFNSINSLKLYPIKFLFIVIASSAILFSVRFHGSPETVSKICRNIVQHGFHSSMCSGAVSAIGWGMTYTLNDLKNHFPLYFQYIPLFVLSQIPLIRTSWFKKNKKIYFSSFVFVSPLFFLVTDYGRWIFLFTCEVSLICLMTIFTKEKQVVSLLKISFFLFFIFAWTLPYWLTVGKSPILSALINSPILRLVELLNS